MRRPTPMNVPQYLDYNMSIGYFKDDSSVHYGISTKTLADFIGIPRPHENIGT